MGLASSKARTSARQRHAQHTARLLAERRGWLCHWCAGDLTLETLTADHVLPLSRGGGDGPDNVVPSCARCNHLRAKHHHRDDFAAAVWRGIIAEARRRTMPTSTAPFAHWYVRRLTLHRGDAAAASATARSVERSQPPHEALDVPGVVDDPVRAAGAG